MGSPSRRSFLKQAAAALGLGGLGLSCATSGISFLTTDASVDRLVEGTIASIPKHLDQPVARILEHGAYICGSRNGGYRESDRKERVLIIPLDNPTYFHAIADNDQDQLPDQVTSLVPMGYDNLGITSNLTDEHAANISPRFQELAEAIIKHYAGPFEEIISCAQPAEELARAEPGKPTYALIKEEGGPDILRVWARQSSETGSGRKSPIIGYSIRYDEGGISLSILKNPVRRHADNVDGVRYWNLNKSGLPPHRLAIPSKGPFNLERGLVAETGLYAAAREFSSKNGPTIRL